MKIPNGHPQDFDEALRRVHRDAIAHVSVPTQAQLHQRRRAVLSGRSIAASTATRRFAWPVAASFAALLALAIGVQIRQDVLPTASTPALTAVDEGDIEGVATLDENPEFYLWLASKDAVALASE